MKEIKAIVNEVSYKMNYADGEVDSTYSSSQVMTQEFDSVQQAVEWFKENYEDTSSPELKAFVDNDSIIALRKPQQVNDYQFENATDDSIAKWKNNELDLWDLSYKLILIRQELVCDSEYVDLF